MVLLVVSAGYAAILLLGSYLFSGPVLALYHHLAPNLWLIGVSLIWIGKVGLALHVLQPGRRWALGAAVTGLMIVLLLVMTLYWPDRSRASVSLSVFATILLVPVAEELFFRGIVLDFLLRRLKSSPLTVVLVSALFGLAHLPQGLTVAVVMLLLSIVFASVTLATGSLVWAIILHLGWNALAVLRDLSYGTSRWSAAAVALAAIAGLVILSMLRNRTSSEDGLEEG